VKLIINIKYINVYYIFQTFYISLCDWSLLFLLLLLLLLQWIEIPSGKQPPYFRGFAITLRHTTLVTPSLDERSTRRKDLYLKTRNTRRRQTPMTLARFETTIPANEQPQTHSLDRAVTSILPSFLSHFNVDTRRV
jgi:hypothetical protein